jgi:hypothetical protein
LSKCAIFSSYTFLIFSTWLLEESVEVTTAVYILEAGVGMAFEDVIISKSESDHGMRREECNS